MDNFEEFMKNEQIEKIEKFRYLNESAKKGETLFYRFFPDGAFSNQ